jgi:GntR family transcriptional regulator
MTKEQKGLNKSSPKPLYQQLDEIFRYAIYSREWEPNNAIPSELVLSRIYDVSRMTVRQVITQLVNEGLLRRVQGKGTFVSQPKIPAKSPAYMGIREQLERMGYKMQTKLVSIDTITADARTAGMLDITEGDELYDLLRVRTVDGEPISLHTSLIPKSLSQGLEKEKIETQQLCTILAKKYFLKSALVHETLESVTANKRECELLEIPLGQPLLKLEDIHRTATGRIFEYTRVVFRGDKIKLSFDYQVNTQRV